MPSPAIPPQKRMTSMLGHPVPRTPIDLMFDAVYAHCRLPWQFWKCDVASEERLSAAIAGVRALGFAGAMHHGGFAPSGLAPPQRVAAVLADGLHHGDEVLGWHVRLHVVH